MNKNKIYTAISFFAILAMLLPGKSTFANTETSSRERGDSDEVRTGTVKQDDDEDDDSDESDKARTGTNEREDEDKNENGTGTAREEKGENEADEHRSAVASFVQGLLKVADRNKGGIGEEVRAVAREQDESEATTTKAIAEVESRGSLKTFFLGTDYKNLGMLRSEMVKTANRLDRLNRLLASMTTSTGATSTLEQVQVLTRAQAKLEAFLKADENKFSLFGWFMKWFNRE